MIGGSKGSQMRRTRRGSAALSFRGANAPGEGGQSGGHSLIVANGCHTTALIALDRYRERALAHIRTPRLMMRLRGRRAAAGLRRGAHACMEIPMHATCIVRLQPPCVMSLVRASASRCAASALDCTPACSFRRAACLREGGGADAVSNGVPIWAGVTMKRLASLRLAGGTRVHKDHMRAP